MECWSNGVMAPDNLRLWATPNTPILHHSIPNWRLATELHRPLLCFRQTLSSESFRAVLPHGNAPWSAGYRPAALLLSYRRKMAESAGNAPASGGCRISFSGRVPPAWIGLDSVAPSRGFAPRPLALTGRWTTVIPRWNCETGLPGRTLTCILRVRTSAFCMLNYGEWENGRAPRFCPEYLPVPGRADCYLPRARKMATRTGAAPAVSCSTGRRVCCSSSGSLGWWVMVVTLHSSSSDLLLRRRFYGPLAGSSPELARWVGAAPTSSGLGDLTAHAGAHRV